MQVWYVLHVTRWKYRTQKWCKKSPSGHHPTTLSGYIFATKACIDNRKKLVKQQYLFHMCPQYGELRPTSGWDRFGSLGHPSYFQRLMCLGSVTARHVHVVVGVSQILWRWTEGATYVRQGDHHVGHWPTFLVSAILWGKLCKCLLFWHHFHSKGSDTLESCLSKVTFESNLQKKLSRIEHVLIERREIAKVFVTHVQVFFRKCVTTLR